MDNIDYEALDDLSGDLQHFYAKADREQWESEALDMFLQINGDMEDDNGVVGQVLENGWDEISRELIEHKLYDTHDDKVYLLPFCYKYVKPKISRM